MIKIGKDDNVVVLTGAGISAESGLKTFRDNDGLWENNRVEDVATPVAYARDPEMVWRFYKARYFQLDEVKPNPAHYVLVRLQNSCGDLKLITQNVDGLHQKAGSKQVWEMHGALQNAFCPNCSSKFLMSQLDLDQLVPTCPNCGSSVRPDIVWFGEMPHYLDEIQNSLSKADYFITIGTSGVVYPAAQFIQLAKYFGAKIIVVNLEKPDNALFSDYFFQGESGKILPDLVEEWIKR